MLFTVLLLHSADTGLCMILSVLSTRSLISVTHRPGVPWKTVPPRWKLLIRRSILEFPRLCMTMTDRLGAARRMKILALLCSVLTMAGVLSVCSLLVARIAAVIGMLRCDLVCCAVAIRTDLSVWLWAVSPLLGVGTGMALGAAVVVLELLVMVVRLACVLVRVWMTVDGRVRSTVVVSNVR